MKASYDPRTDTLSLILKDGATVAESDEDKPGIILDYDESGDLVSMEILDLLRFHAPCRSLHHLFGRSDVGCRRSFLSAQLVQQVRFRQPQS